MCAKLSVVRLLMPTHAYKYTGLYNNDNDMNAHKHDRNAGNDNNNIGDTVALRIHGTRDIFAYNKHVRKCKCDDARLNVTVQVPGSMNGAIR